MKDLRRQHKVLGFTAVIALLAAIVPMTYAGRCPSPCPNIICGLGNCLCKSENGYDTCYQETAPLVPI